MIDTSGIRSPPSHNEYSASVYIMSPEICQFSLAVDHVSSILNMFDC